MGAGAARDPRQSREKDLEDVEDFCWIRCDGEERLATQNMVPGNQVYKERLINKRHVEYRVWDPFRSKLAAAIMNGLDEFPFKAKTAVLYLGASSGTTVSHLSDITGPNGIIFAVEHASRSTRDFLDRVANHRSNVIPIMQDARKPKEYFAIHGRVDVVYSDIAQPDQTDIAIANCDRFLKPGGFLFIVIKTRSIDATKRPSEIVKMEEKKIRDGFEILQTLNLYPFDRDHAMVVAKARS